MVDLQPFLDSVQPYIDSHDDDPRLSFLRHLQSCGFTVDGIISGDVQRVPCPGESLPKKSGWYFYNEATVNDRIMGIAVYGSFKGNPEKEQWCSRTHKQMSVGERMAYAKRLEEAQERHKLLIEERQLEAKRKASDALKNSRMADSEHGYIKRKGLRSFNTLRQKDDLLLVSMTDGLETTGIQYIHADGTKRFLSGSKLKGSYHIIGGKQDMVVIAEGYATASTLHDILGCTVYVAFNCNNLYEVSAKAVKDYPHATVIIAADNDQFTESNPGKTKAKQAAESLNITYIAPEFSNLESKPTDFNDLYILEGEEQCRNFFGAKQTEVAVYKKKRERVNNLPLPPEGALRDVYNYYNATSGIDQHGFAMQTAIALGSIICGRRFVSDYSNYSSLFFMNVGKSGTGKEHAKNVIEKVLTESGNAHLVNGDGYTSGGAVFSSLMFRPRHITVIDELGRYLEVTGNNRRTNNHLREANTKLMEAVGRCHSAIRPQSYSTMTLTKEQQKQAMDRIVYNPAITLLGMSTPSTLFASLTADAVKDGFINRFIISISDAERQVRRHRPPLAVPESIIDWVKRIDERASHITEEYAIASEPIELAFSENAMKHQESFQHYCIEMADKLELHGMAELTGRSNEMAMRIALIAALAEDVEATHIRLRHIEWAIDYVKCCLEKTIDSLKMAISGSEHEADKKEILQALRNSSPEWVRRGDMNKTPPYSKFTRKDLNEILEQLVEAGLVAKDTAPQDGKRGRPTVQFLALD